MTTRRAFVLAASLWVLSVGLLAGSVAYGLAHPSVRIASGQPGQVFPFVVVLLFVASFTTVGALLGWKRPSNPIGWLLSVTGLSYALATFGITLGSLFGPGWSGWLGNWLWGFGVGISGTFVLLLFPTGSLPSRRWRPVAWLAAAGLGAFALGRSFAPGAVAGPRSTNPLGVHGPLGAVFRVMQGGFGLVVVAAIASIVSVGLRFRRSRDVERQQIKWLLFAGALILVAIAAQAPIGHFARSQALATNLQNGVISIAFVLVPIAIGIAVLRYRLYDIDVVINKTVVYGALAAFITAVYVGIVVGIGTALGHRTSRPNLALSILATAVVAVAFQPVRERVQRVANRLVYGRRATPYEVLAGFVRRVAGTYAAEDVLPRMARALAEGTGAASAAVWLKMDGELRPAASWPASRLRDFAPLPMGAGGLPGLPDLPGVSLLLPVVERGETLGALTVTKAAGDPLQSTERNLAEHLAGQAGLVLRNVGLTEELAARVREVHVSRDRIVSAEEEERRRIERRIDEGTRRDLLATAGAIDEAAVRLLDDPERSMRSLETVGQRTTRALESLREVARGIYPPLLADKGLTAAVEAQAARAPVPVTVRAEGLGRYPQEVEAAVYFCCLEALQNAAAHANPSRVLVVLADSGDGLAFEVTDDGSGFDRAAAALGTGLQTVSDRVAALGGSLDVRSAPGEGTVLSGSLPVGLLEAVP